MGPCGSPPLSSNCRLDEILNTTQFSLPILLVLPAGRLAFLNSRAKALGGNDFLA